jgi:hypothetical protein
MRGGSLCSCDVHSVRCSLTIVALAARSASSTSWESFCSSGAPTSFHSFIRSSVSRAPRVSFQPSGQPRSCARGDARTRTGRNCRRPGRPLGGQARSRRSSQSASALERGGFDRLQTAADYPHTLPQPQHCTRREGACAALSADPIHARPKNPAPESSGGPLPGTVPPTVRRACRGRDGCDPAIAGECGAGFFSRRQSLSRRKVARGTSE